MIIGITGGIGSGKTVVCSYIAKKGAVIISADQVGHELYKKETQTYQRILTSFGRHILNKSGEIDRKKLADIVFTSSSALRLLEKITWPKIRENIKKKIDEVKAQDSFSQATIAIEAAKLIEAGWIDMVDQIWLIKSPLDQVRLRLQARGMELDDINRILQVQGNILALESPSLQVIHNDSSLHQLRVKVDGLYALAGKIS